MRKAFLEFVLITVVILSCNSKYPVNLGDGYQIDYDGNSYSVIINAENDIIIDAHVIKYNFDSTFIIAEQKPREVILKNSYDDIEMNFDKREKIFNESPIRLYWIIDKKKKSVFNEKTITYSNVYGPYHLNEYFQKRKELGIPKELEFKDE